MAKARLLPVTLPHALHAQTALPLKSSSHQCFEPLASGRNVKIKTGDWFFEERAKKFPTEGKHETAGAKLLQSYQKLSKISVVPPTPPPLSESQCGGGPARLQELGQFKGFNKSVENLFLSVTTHMKKLSKSQNDMTSDKQHPETVPRQREGRPERRSQSDTAINVTTRVGTPDILKPLSPESPRRPTSPVLKQEDISSSPVLNTLFSGGLRQRLNLLGDPGLSTGKTEAEKTLPVVKS